MIVVMCMSIPLLVASVSSTLSLSGLPILAAHVSANQVSASSGGDEKLGAVQDVGFRVVVAAGAS